MDHVEATVKCRAQGCINGWIHSRQRWYLSHEPPSLLRDEECRACDGRGVVVRKVRAYYDPGMETIELPKELS